MQRPSDTTQVAGLAAEERRHGRAKQFADMLALTRGLARRHKNLVNRISKADGDNCMAHLWVTTESNQWAVLPLEDEAFTLATSPPMPVRRPLDDGEVLSSVLLMRTRGADALTWVLIAGAGSSVSVNGLPLATGMRVVSDRDEIRIPGVSNLYFSTESLARVEEFSGSDQALFCPRCKQEIEKGAAAVKCPACGVWHHQTEELNCWTYSEACALCAHETDLSAGFQWTPEGL